MQTLKKGDILIFGECPSHFNGYSIPVRLIRKPTVFQKLSNRLRKKDPDAVLVDLPVMRFRPPQDR